MAPGEEGNRRHMDTKKSEVLQGTLDLMILKTLHALGLNWLRPGPAHRAGQPGRAATQRRHGLHLAAAPPAAGLDRRALGHVGEQPQGEVLFHQQSAAKNSWWRQKMAPHFRRHRPRPAAGIGRGEPWASTARIPTSRVRGETAGLCAPPAPPSRRRVRRRDPGSPAPAHGPVRRARHVQERGRGRRAASVRQHHHFA